MVIVKANADTEAGVMPSEDLLAAMGAYNQELVAAGIMAAGDGLHPSNKGKRVRFGPRDASGKKVETKVIDGPFAEARELVAGFWIWKVDSMEQAIEWARRAPMEDTELELRPVFEAEDFGAEFTPELRAQEQRLRDEIKAQKGRA
jgi:hypothetical protein